MIETLIENIHWLGHDSFRIEGSSQVIYVDPWQIKAGTKADLILVTHNHHDHCSPEDIEKVQKESTVIVTIAEAAKDLSGRIQIVEPGNQLSVGDTAIQVVPAYNLNKFRSPGNPFHPQTAGHVGFVINVDGVRIYHTGDTDYIPEMETIQADVILVPVSGIYVMTAEEAIQATASIQPQVAIPMHVGRSIGSLSDAERFKEGASVEVRILDLE